MNMYSRVAPTHLKVNRFFEAISMISSNIFRYCKGLGDIKSLFLEKSSSPGVDSILKKAQKYFQ